MKYHFYLGIIMAGFNRFNTGSFPCIDFAPGIHSRCDELIKLMFIERWQSVFNRHIFLYCLIFIKDRFSILAQGLI